VQCNIDAKHFNWGQIKIKILLDLFRIKWGHIKFDSYLRWMDKR